jgi:uncharacterized membrane protein
MQPAEFRTGVIKPIECVKEAWEIIKPDYWLLMAIFIVGALVGAISLYILIGAMVCGIMYCYLRRIDGLPVTFDDLWRGFKFFWPSLPVTILVFVPAVLWAVVLVSTIYLPIIMSAMMGERLANDELMATLGGALAVDLVVALIMVCFHTLLTFSFPLVVDRGLTGLKPAVVSAKAVLKNLKGIGGLIGVNFVLAVAGELACGIGIYFAIPLVMATSLVAYRKVFPIISSSPHLNPPPPNAYSDLQ